MKISKKIFGVALAIIMIFNVFVVGSYAAVPADTLVQLNLSTDKTVYAPGETVTIMFSAQCIKELELLSVGGQYEIGYNSAVLEPYSTKGEDISAHGFVGIQAGAMTGQASIQMPAQSSGASALYDWDTTIAYCFPDDGTAFDATEGVDLFTVNMKIKEDAPNGTYTIGFNPAGYEEGNGYINDGLGMGGLYGMDAKTEYGFSVNNMYALGTYTFTVSSAPAVTVSHTGEQAKWNGGDANNTADNYLFGFLGNVEGITVETTEQDGHDVVTNIQSIVATASYNGSTVTSEVATIWVEGEGYGFRAVFKGFDPADTKNVSVTFAITMSDGTTTYTTAEPSVDTPNAIYLAAVSRGMPAVRA